MRESEVLAQCLQFLSLLPRCLAIRINSGALKPDGGGKRRYVRFNSAAGCSDVIFCLGGRFCACECKAKKGKLKPHQRAFLDDVVRCGGLAFVVRSVEELRLALFEEGLLDDVDLRLGGIS
jgi:hypothetical protein